jgi:hypothetical protein
MTLIVSSQAAQLMLELLQAANMPPYGGLRISIDDRYDSLSMALSAAPEPSDAVVNGPDGSRVFLSPGSARRLSHSTLEADNARNGPSFYLT